MALDFLTELELLSRLLVDDFESTFKSPYRIALILLDYNLKSF